MDTIAKIITCCPRAIEFGIAAVHKASDHILLCDIGNHRVRPFSDLILFLYAY